MGQPTHSEDSKLEPTKPDAESGKKAATKKSGKKAQESKGASGGNGSKKASRERKSAKTKSSSKLQQSLVGDNPELAESPQPSEQTARNRQTKHPEPGDASSEQAGEPTENASEASEQKTKRKVAQRRGSASKKQTGETENSETEDAVASALEKVAEAKRDQAPSEQGNEPEADLESLAAAIAGEGEEPDEETPTRRRRRRRGGRRRRKPTDGQGVEPAEGADSEVGEDEADVETPAQADGESGTRRRRRRRRGDSSDSGDETIRVREPRSSRRGATDEVTGIEGSTRMEAKRQRRKDSRTSGRRRSSILSEAEFLARRESVNREMVIRQSEDYTQVAVLEDGVLVEHYVDRASAASLIGNIYLGKVQNVLPSMEAAFIDIGRGRNAVLYAGEVDWESLGVSGEDRKIESALSSGQQILVQVSKDPVGAKGARLTGHISLPGRYIVYSPGGQLSGISRKLADTERARLRTILGGLISESESVIVRTAAEGADEAELVRDVNRLRAQWEVIEKKVKQGGAPKQLYAEPDLTVKIVRDLFTEDFSSLVIAGTGGQDDMYEAVSAYVAHVAPDIADRVSRWDTEKDGDLFAKYRIDAQISKALERKVFLPSGGSLVIDRTEAMTVIDVNTGRFTGSDGNLEATVTKNNLEAAEEIVRQLRLRDIGGIIVIDFIDMVLSSNRELLVRRLVECLGRDRTRHQVAEVTSLGLVQLTRKKIGTGLAEAFNEPCQACGGLGYHTQSEPSDTQAQADGGERTGRRRGKGKK